MHDKLYFFLGYIDYVAENHGTLVVESVLANKKTSKQLDREMPLRKISVKDSCEMLVGKCDLSQRDYTTLGEILKRSNIKVSRYQDAIDYAAKIDIGKIEYLKHWETNECEVNCMHASTSAVETLSLIASTPEIFNRFEFVGTELQESLFRELQSESPIYKNLDSSKRTIFLRDTGDNFRASKNYPTEQISFNVMNLKEMLNSPYGQFATSLFRGSENRETLQSHGQAHFNELQLLVEKGITLKLPNQTTEHFNVIVFFVADIGYVKEVIGKASCTSTNGCYRCTKTIDKWDASVLSHASSQSVENYIKLGAKAEEKLGRKPDKDSSEYKDFIKKHYGQWVCLFHFPSISNFLYPFNLFALLIIHTLLCLIVGMDGGHY